MSETRLDRIRERIEYVRDDDDMWLLERLDELTRAMEQAVREYDELGPSGPVMYGIHKWGRAALARLEEA